MTNWCPYHHPIPSQELKKNVQDGVIISPAQNALERYSNFAIAFEQYTRDNNPRIFLSLADLYDPCMDKMGYLLAMRTWIYDDIQWAQFSLFLNGWMTTLFLMLHGVSQSKGYEMMSEDEIVKKMIYFMWSIDRYHIPSTNLANVAEAYSVYVAELLQSNTPEWYIKNHNQKRKQLPCPILYSENGKKFIKWIIRLFIGKMWNLK